MIIANATAKAGLKIFKILKLNKGKIKECFLFFCTKYWVLFSLNFLIV